MNKIKDAALTAAGIIYGDTFLKKTEYWNYDFQKNYQTSKLKKLFIECFNNIPWYQNIFKELQCNPNYDDTLDIYKNLPILDKKTVRENTDQFINKKINGPFSFQTSGTSGEPLTVFTHADQWINEQGVIWRSWRRAGFKLGDKVAIFRSYTPKNSDPIIKIDKIRNWAYLSIYHTSERNLEEYANFLESWRPKYLRGYPSSILLLTKYLKDKNIEIPSLRAIFTASEMLTYSTRRQVYSNTGLEIFDHYGQAEITAMFHDCEKHEGMHYDWEYGRVDLNPSAINGLYKIIATNLHNKAMPLIKYDTGDLSGSKFLVCTCGRSSSIISQITGRDIDFIIKSDGSKIPAVNFYTHFSKVKLAKRIQIIQDEPGTISVRFEPWIFNNRKNAHDEIAVLAKNLSQVIGVSMIIDFDKDIIMSKSGKEKFIVQRSKIDI